MNAILTAGEMSAGAPQRSGDLDTLRPGRPP